MRATIVDKHVYVTLSRRNLRELQTMLDDRSRPERSLGRKGDNGIILVVEVEDDAEHYQGCAPGPGSHTVLCQHGG
jgi:hypothetical protein